jgi:hypothetical protein
VKADAAFLADFAESRRTVMQVGQWMADLGYDVHMPVAALRPAAETRAHYADDGDLVIQKVVEVKHRGIDFTSAADYPYPSVFVNERYKLTRERLAKVWGYVVVNRAETHVAVVLTTTYDKWLDIDAYDKNQDRMCTFAACPVGHVKFYPIARDAAA